MKERNKQMALMTLFATVLVVIGHSDITSDYKELWIYKWCYSFHMPLFFFISGFLFCLTNPVERLRKTSYTAFMRRKGVRLLLPFFFINSLIFLIKALIIHDTAMMQHPVSFSWDSFVDSTFFHPIGFMWFLPTLFLIFAMAYPILKLQLYFNRLPTSLINGNGGGEKKPLIIMVLTTIVVFWLLDCIIPTIYFLRISSAIQNMPYFFVGVLYCIQKETVDRFILRYKYFLITAFGFLSISLLSTGRLAAFTGIFFSTVIALVVADKLGSKMLHLSEYTYQVFLLSYFVQMFIRGPVASHWCSNVNQYVLSGFSFVAGLVFPLLFCEIFTRLRGNNRMLTWCGRLIGL